MLTAAGMSSASLGVSCGSRRAGGRRTGAGEGFGGSEECEKLVRVDLGRCGVLLERSGLALSVESSSGVKVTFREHESRIGKLDRPFRQLESLRTTSSVSSRLGVEEPKERTLACPVSSPCTRKNAASGAPAAATVLSFLNAAWMYLKP